IQEAVATVNRNSRCRRCPKLQFNSLVDLLSDIDHLAAESDDPTVRTNLGRTIRTARIGYKDGFDGIANITPKELHFKQCFLKDQMRIADVPVAAVFRL